MIDNNRIIIVDDNEPIHLDYEKALIPRNDQGNELKDLENRLFEDIKESPVPDMEFRLVHVYSGNEAIDMVEESRQQMDPFAVAFVDERMPPGIDGIETIQKIWAIDPHIEIVICTAFSDYSWREILDIFGMTDKLLILKKPFDIIEVKQITLALMKKWNLARDNRVFKREMQRLVEGQTSIIISMFEFANTLHTLENTEAILDCVLDALCRFTHSGNILILLLDKKKEAYVPVKSTGLSDIGEIRLEKCSEEHCFQLKRPYIVNAPEESKCNCLFTKMKELTSYPYLCAPMFGKNEQIGLIFLTNNEEDIPFGKQDEDIISYIAHTSAVALDNRLHEMEHEAHLLKLISTIVDSIESKEYVLRGHPSRVAVYALGIREELNATDIKEQHLHFGALLHDLGKVEIPDTILCKKEPLLAEERELIQSHCDRGVQILKDLKLGVDVENIVKYHHERMDGSGYPLGLEGPDIPQGAMIVGVADVFDAMNSDKVYREKFSLIDIKHEMLADDKLDKRCVQALFGYLERNNII